MVTNDFRKRDYLNIKVLWLFLLLINIDTYEEGRAKESDVLNNSTASSEYSELMGMGMRTKQRTHKSNFLEFF